MTGVGTDRESAMVRERVRLFAGIPCKKLAVLVVPFNDILFDGLFSTNAVLRSYWLLVEL